MSDLKGKFAVVTGAGKGIGAAIAARFLREQAAGVAIWDYDLCLAEQTAVQLGGNAVAICCDVSDSAQVAAATQATLAAFGRIDILVNNAGITRGCAVPEYDRKAVERRAAHQPGRPLSLLQARRPSDAGTRAMEGSSIFPLPPPTATLVRPTMPPPRPACWA